MKSEYKKLIILLLVNILIICLLTLVNSRLSSWGTILFLPGLFFFSSCIHLDTPKGIILCIITGLFLDVVYNTNFGFIGITLPILHISGKQWLKSTVNNKPWRPVFFQLFANIILSIIWFIILLFENKSNMKWEISRFMSEVFISSILFLPICFWNIEFTMRIIKITCDERLDMEDE
jgi:rod shape-determining protein MreD